MNVGGTWRGTYRYDDEGGAVEFTLQLVQDAAGVVSGAVIEGPGGMPETGRVIGSCRRGRLEFLKLMPVARVGGPGGTQELAAFLASAGYVVRGSIEHPQLIYIGRLGADARTVHGTWRLDDYAVPLVDGQMIRIPGSSGSWSATRDGA